MSKTVHSRRIEFVVTQAQYEEFDTALKEDRRNNIWYRTEVEFDDQLVKSLSDMIRYRVLQAVPELREENEQLEARQSMFMEDVNKRDRKILLLTHEIETLKAEEGKSVERLSKEFVRALTQESVEHERTKEMFAFARLALIRRKLIKFTVEEKASLEAFEARWIKMGGTIPKLEDEEQMPHHHIIKTGDFRRTRVHIEQDAEGNDVMYPVVDGKIDRTSPIPTSKSNGSSSKAPS